MIILQNLNAPLSTSIEITTKCNNRCKYCFNYQHGQDEMSITNFRKILTILKKEKVLFIKLNGGEPLVHSKFKQISFILHKYNCFNRSIVTNGLLIDKYYKIINKCYDKIGISLDGPRKIHSSLRGELSFDKIITNISKIKIPKIMYVTISRLNYKCVDDIIKMGERYNFTSIVFLFYKPIGLGHQFKKDLNLTERNKHQFKLSLDKVKTKTKLYLHDSKSDSCPGGSELININVFGNVGPCCFVDKFCGDIFNDNFKDIIYNLKELKKKCNKSWCHRI